jgi:hypothetical protein
MFASIVEREQCGCIASSVAQKLAELLSRVAANDREVDYINKHALPKGAGRLLETELTARGMQGWVTNSIQTPRVIDVLCLPPWHPRSNYLWPPGMK